MNGHRDCRLRAKSYSHCFVSNRSHIWSLNTTDYDKAKDFLIHNSEEDIEKERESEREKGKEWERERERERETVRERERERQRARGTDRVIDHNFIWSVFSKRTTKIIVKNFRVLFIQRLFVILSWSFIIWWDTFHHRFIKKRFPDEIFQKNKLYW